MGPAAAVLAELSGEDAIRAIDRAKVLKARAERKRGRLMWLLVGPGILAMLGENDGPSMISYATNGAELRNRVLPAVHVVMFAMAFVCQEMCMRVGSVTHRGYGELVLQRFGRAWGWFAAGDLVLTNVVTLIAEFVAIRVGLAYFGLGTGVAGGLGLVLVVLHAQRRALLALGALVLGLAPSTGCSCRRRSSCGPTGRALGHALETSRPLPTASINTLLLLSPRRSAPRSPRG